MLGMWEWLKWLGVGESPRLSYFVWSADLTAAKESLQRIARAWFLSSNRDPGSFLGSAIALTLSRLRCGTGFTAAAISDTRCSKLSALIR
jgi:hypothetical protein